MQNSPNKVKKRARESSNSDIQTVVKKSKLENKEKESRSEILNSKQNSFLNTESLLYHSIQQSNNLNLLWRVTFQKQFFTKNFILNDAHNDHPHEEILWELSISSSNSNINNGNFLFKINCKSLKNTKNFLDKSKNSTSSRKSSIKLENQSDENLASKPEIKDFNDFEEFIDYSAEIDLVFFQIPKKSINFKLKNLKSNESTTKEISIPSEIYLKMLKEDIIVIIFDITITKVYSKLRSHPNFKYTGLINEGMTCYMNSMLQTLNVLGAFKKAVFQIPYREDENSSNSIVISLQRLFYDLMTDKNAVSTNRLIKSFGWGRDETLVQHDVQEFNLLLSDTMDKKMKGTTVEGTFSKLFEGKILNYIHCENIDYQSKKKEKFCDLQLTVKDCKNIYESFDKYIEEEILDNENKYETEGHGKQAAKKGVKFHKFPNVLILQLKRFEYNYRREQMVKINDSFEFYETIDLKKYIDQKSKHNKDNVFTLHSIVVHKGSATSGHYYSYIRPGLEDFWLKFNDDIVRPANKLEVFNNNFGGQIKQFRYRGKGEIFENVTISDANAYILVYIRNNCRQSILQPISSFDIPVNLREKFDTEKTEEHETFQSKIRMENNIYLILLSKEILFGKKSIGVNSSLVDVQKELPFQLNKHSRFILNFPKKKTFGEFLNFISSQTNIPISELRLFHYTQSQNILTRFNYKLSNVSLDKMIDQFSIENTHSDQLPLTLFINSDYEIFHKSAIEKDNVKLNENEEAFIPRKINSWNFKLNGKNQEIKHLNVKNGILVFLKFIQEKENYIEIHLCETIFLSGDMSLNKLETQLNLKEKAKLKAPNLISNSNFYISFLLEKNNTNTHAENQLSEVKNDLTLSNLLAPGEISLCLIINPIVQSNEKTSSSIFGSNSNISQIITINNLVQNEFSNLWLNLCFVGQTENKYQNKFEFRLYDTEDDIKDKIVKLMKYTEKFEFIFQSEKYLTYDQRLVSKSEIKNNISKDNIELIYKNTSNNKEFSILKFINDQDHSIYFDYKIMSVNESNYFQKDIVIFDIDNNIKELVSVCIPKKIKTFCDLIEFAYDLILVNYFNEFSKNEFILILQNKQSQFIYEIIELGGSQEIFNYDNYKIEFRIQPYKFKEDNSILLYNSGVSVNKLKIFFVVHSKDGFPVANPFFLIIENNISMKEFYLNIVEKLEKIKHFTQEDIQNFKIFKAKLSKEKFEKKQVVTSTDSNESIMNFLKESSSFFNMVIEINKSFKSSSPQEIKIK